MMKKVFDLIFRIVLIFIFVSIYVLEPMKVKAFNSNDTLGDLKRDLAALKAKKQQQENEKHQTEAEIQAKKDAIYKANQEIAQAEEDIEQAEAEIKASEEKIEELTAETENLLAFMQMMQGENAYLEYVTGSSSITELIMRLKAVEQITDYNTENLESLKALIEQNKQLKKDLIKKQEENEQKKVEYQNTINSLGENLKEIAEITIDIDSEIKILEESVATYTMMGCHDEQSLASCAKVVESKTWLKPVAKARVSSDWGMRYHPTKKIWTMHNGIDIAIGEGTKLYSATNGRVVAVSNSNSCGGRQLYITSTVAGKKYTVYYFHLLDIYVKVGDVVTDQTLIASSGGGSRAKANARANGWKVDTCSTGGHLHFGVATGWYTVDYKYYSGIVANNINPPGYPKAGNYFYSRTQFFN